MKKIFVNSNLYNLTKDKEIIHYKNGFFSPKSAWDFTHTLYINLFFLKKEEVRLHSLILKQNYGTHYAKMLKYLIDNDIIEKRKNYIIGNKATTWALKDKSEPIMILLDEQRLIHKRNVLIDNENMKPVYKWLIEKFNHCSLDIEEKELKEYHYSIAWLAESIKKKEWFYSIDANGRLYSPFTTLKKELRERVLIDGEKNSCKDIKNSQPLFLTKLMKKNNFYDEIFFNDVLEGVLYENLSKHTNGNRKMAKKMLFVALFGNNTGKNNTDLLLIKTYPKTYEFIIEYKKRCAHYSVLANTLQKLEAKWMFNFLIPKIIPHNIPIFTVHDSIYYPASKENIINEYWDKFIERLKNN